MDTATVTLWAMHRSGDGISRFAAAEPARGRRWATERRGAQRTWVRMTLSFLAYAGLIKNNL